MLKQGIIYRAKFFAYIYILLFVYVKFYTYIYMCKLKDKTMTEFKRYLINLIEEKGKSIHSDIEGFDDHIGLTYEVLIEFLTNLPRGQQNEIRTKLVMIDFKAGDVFHFLNYLTKGMIEMAGY